MVAKLNNRIFINPKTLGILALIATAALWGSNHVASRAARDAVPLPALMFWRWAPALVILTVVALPAIRRGWPEIRPRLPELIVGGAIGVGLFSLCLISGAYQSLAIEVGFINATTPVWVLLLGLVMGTGRFTTAMKIGLALAFVGTVLIITKGQLTTLAAFHLNLGNLWSLIAAMSFAWFSIRVRMWSRVIETLPLTVVTAWGGMIVVTLPIYLFSIARGDPWLVWQPADFNFALAICAYVSLGPTLLGNQFYIYGVATNGPARAASFLYLSPLCTAAFSILWLGEQLAWYHIAGILLIFTGLVVLSKSGTTAVRAKTA